MRLSLTGVTATALALVMIAGCAAAPTPSPTPTPSPSPSPSPSPTPRPSPTPTPSPTPSPTPAGATGPAGRPTRIAIPTLEIDLPIVIPPKTSTWPLCDVAEYFRKPAFQHPGAGGVTYIYAHAQEGMFLPLLTKSKRRNGKAMLGMTVTVWSNRNHRYTYEVTEVRRHQKKLTWAFDLPPNSLVLQTSEDQYRTGPKLMLVARQVGDPVLVGQREAHPKAKPRRCG